MSAFDYCLLLILLASAFLGLWRGIVGEILAFLSWVFAFFAASLWGVALSEIVLSTIENEDLRHIAGYALVFLGVLMIISLIRLAMRALLNAVGLGPTDRFFGFLFGFLRGAFIIFLLALVLNITSFMNAPWFLASRSAPFLKYAVASVKPYLPLNLADKIQTDNSPEILIGT